MNFISLGYVDLALSSFLLLIAGILSVVLKLDMERGLGIAALRMVIQLSLIGMVLKILFESVSPLWAAVAAMVMIGFAGREVVGRQKHKFVGLWTYGLGTTSMLLAGTLVTLFALNTSLRPEPWYDPRYAIPILGMVLGNTLNGVSMGVDRFLSAARRDKAAIEARLALGHPRGVALRPFVRESCRAGIMHVVNAMSAAGLVFLPGMMTGQILAGAEPMEAVKYQIFIMLLLAGSNSIGVLSAVAVTAWRLTDDRHRLRLDRLRAP